MSNDSQKSKEQKQNSGAGGTLAGILGGATAVGGLAAVVGAIASPLYFVGAAVLAAAGFTAGRNNYNAIFGDGSYSNKPEHEEPQPAYSYAH